MFLSRAALKLMNFKSIGENVLISEHANIYNAANISIGDNCRIDDFCILSAGEGGIEIGSHVHIACYASLRGAAKITIGKYCSVAAYSSILSSTDEYSGEYLMNPCIDFRLRKVYDKPVVMKDRSIIAQYCFVMPGVTIGFNTAVGAYGYINKDLPDNGIYIGQPAKFLKERKQLITQYLGHIGELEYKGCKGNV